MSLYSWIAYSIKSKKNSLNVPFTYDEYYLHWVAAYGTKMFLKCEICDSLINPFPVEVKFQNL